MDFRLCKQSIPSDCKCSLAHSMAEVNIQSTTVRSMRWRQHIERTYNKPTQCFLLASDRGDHTTVQMLVNIFGQEINHHAENEGAFRWACEHGHGQLVGYLLEMFPDINTRIWNDWAFRWACRNGHMHIVKMFVDQYGEYSHNSVNIHAQNDFALKWARKNGHKEIVDLLQGIIDSERGVQRGVIDELITTGEDLNAMDASLELYSSQMIDREIERQDNQQTLEYNRKRAEVLKSRQAEQELMASVVKRGKKKVVPLHSLGFKFGK